MIRTDTTSRDPLSDRLQDSTVGVGQMKIM